jgi:branched-chain amino acid transport system substrate-binding protein
VRLVHRQVTAGARLYVQQQGTTAAGKAIELIARDDCRLPGNAKRGAQELIVVDKVKVLAGFELTPLGSAIDRQTPDLKLTLPRIKLSSQPSVVKRTK